MTYDKQCFYLLLWPQYATDRLGYRANPVETEEKLKMPMFDCDVCGNIRTGYRPLFLPVTNIDLLLRLAAPRLQHDEWWALARDLHAYLNLPQNEQIQPGDVLGTPTYEISRTVYSDCVMLVPETFVKDRVAEAMSTAGLTGYNLFKPGFVAGRRYKGPLDELSLLHIHGRAWRKGTQKIVQCERCQRTKRTLVSPEIDVDRWDGADVFTIDGIESIIGLSQKAYRVFVENQVTNVLLLEITPSTPLNPFVL